MHNQPQTNVSDCPESFARWYCLNGATCFSLLIDETIFYNCWCQTGFHGLRCDYKYTTSSRSVEFGDDRRPPSQSTLDISSTPASNRSNGRGGGDDETASFIAVSPDATGPMIGLPNRGLANRRLKNQNRSGQDTQALVVLFYLACLILIVMIIVLVVRLFKRTANTRETGGRTDNSLQGRQQVGQVMIYRSTDKKVGRRLDPNQCELSELDPIQPDRLQQISGGGQSHSMGNDVTQVPLSDNLSRDGIRMLGLACDHKFSNAGQQQQEPPAVVAFATTTTTTSNTITSHWQANDPSEEHARRFHLGAPETIFKTYENACDNHQQQQSRGILEETLDGRLSGAKQGQQYRYLFVQMAIIKRARDMQRQAATITTTTAATETTTVDNNNLAAQPGQDFQSFEV